MRKLLSCLFSLLMVAFLGCTVFAAAPSVTFQSKDAGFAFGPGSAYSPTDLFPDFKNVLPGDRLESQISLQNAHSGKIRIFLDFQGGDQDLAFLQQLHLQVYDGTACIFSASPDQPGTLSAPVDLGVFRPGQTRQLQVVLEVPLHLENPFAKSRGDVIWVFLAEEEPEAPLIQTGQLLWPVCLVAVIGFLLLIAGSILLLKKRHG